MENRGPDKETGEDPAAENGAAGGVPRSPQDSEPAEKRPCLSSPTTSPRPNTFMVPASPPKFVTLEEIMKTAHGVGNMILAHEIAVDNEFSLDKVAQPQSSFEKQVKEILHKAFWDLLEQKLAQDPPDYSQALTLLREVKEALEELLMPQHSKMKAHINEVLDLELIRQKAEHDAIDMAYYADFVIGLMAKLCAPARDERVASLRSIEDTVQLFREIMEVLTLLKRDMANFTLQQIRPFVQQQSVEYEKIKFAEFLKTQQEANVDGLQFTRDWLERSAGQLQCPDSPRESTSGSETNATNPVTLENIVNTAYMELLKWDDRRTTPETVIMDAGRILDCSDQLSRLTLTSSVLLVTYNTVGEPIAGVRDLKEKLKDHVIIIIADAPVSELPSLLDNIADQVLMDVTACLKEHNFRALDETRQGLLRSQIKALTEDNSPVYNIIRKRIHNLIFQLLSAQPGRVQLPPGVSAVSEELSRVCGQFVRLVSHNKAVFGSYYGEIINAIVE